MRYILYIQFEYKVTEWHQVERWSSDRLLSGCCSYVHWEVAELTYILYKRSTAVVSINIIYVAVKYILLYFGSWKTRSKEDKRTFTQSLPMRQVCSVYMHRDDLNPVTWLKQESIPEGREIGCKWRNWGRRRSPGRYIDVVVISTYATF